MSSSGSDDDAAPSLITKPKYSVFVINLSPQISEKIVRDVFEACDKIDKVSFRAYPNSNTQFYAQVDFATAQGVQEGSRLSGVPILGVPCEVRVVDPVVNSRQQQLAKQQGDVLPDPVTARNIEELNRRVTEAQEDQRLRTVHVAGVPEDTDNAMLERFAKNFGPVERVRVDRGPDGKPFGLIEFKERGPAHIAKTQRNYGVDGRLFVCTEAKVMVDESEFVAQTISFQDKVVDAMGMKSILAQQPDLARKLDLVRKAAQDFCGLGDAVAAEAKEKKKKKKKDRVDKQEGKQKKKKKKGKPGKEAKEKKAKKQKRAAKKRKPRRAAAEGGLAADGAEEDESEVASIAESAGGPVDLESELELVDNSELVVLGTSSSGSSSEEPADAQPAKPAKRAAPPPPTLADLVGLWRVVGGDPPGLWTILAGGAALFNGRRVKPKWSLVEAPGEAGGGVGAGIFCEGQRAAGWELDLAASDAARLVWRKAQEAETCWERQADDPGGSPSSGAPPSGAPPAPAAAGSR